MSLLEPVRSPAESRDSDLPSADVGVATTPDPMAATVRLGMDLRTAAAAAPDSRLPPVSEFRLSAMPGDAPMQPDAAAEARPAVDTGLPLLGRWRLASQQTLLALLFGLGLVGVAASTVLALEASRRTTVQVAAAAQAQTQSQRLARAVSQAVAGQAAGFDHLRDSVQAMRSRVQGLREGGPGLAAAPAALAPQFEALEPLLERAERHAGTVAAQQKVLTDADAALRAIGRRSGVLLDLAEDVASLRQQAGAGAVETAALGQLVMLTQRIGRSANELLAPEGVSAEAVFLLGKDLNLFREIAEGVLDGNAELRLSGTRDPAAREQIARLLREFEATRTEAGAILGHLQGLVGAREAQRAILAETEDLSRALDGLQQALSVQGAGAWPLLGAGLLSLLLLAGGGLGLLRVFVAETRARSRVADRQRLEAERQEQEAKRVNDANQAAILRLMNELQTVAEGDLTKQATVTEDITGAIADSVNYTVEELRALVSQVQSTVARVTDTTERVDSTSTELLAASTEQLREIRATGDAVLQMAGRINDVSAAAQETAQVARQSLAAADSGLQAVNNTIGGMNTLRDQIQETSKRIKRLGESSQEIGEITELIGDITDQTNVLALNAAIQAASAGEAGRGFSVVAEEVQRLAERSGDATRQIAALVRTIQADTQDAVAAMERSTQGVVEGARLSDAAGAALADIDRVTRELSDLIERISAEAQREAQLANGVATHIQHIFAVTEQTSEGTRSTAQMVRELSRTAEELRSSVARFKVS
jgi:twitching motility protein PilJ